MATTPELRQYQSRKVTTKIANLADDAPYYTFEVSHPFQPPPAPILVGRTWVGVCFPRARGL